MVDKAEILLQYATDDLYTKEDMYFKGFKMKVFLTFFTLQMHINSKKEFLDSAGDKDFNKFF